jgi:uncharacterized protein with PIN domain
MSEEQQKQKKKKKQQAILLETQEVQSELLPELVEGLEELEKEKKYVDIQVCPKCKSPIVRQVGNMGGDTTAHIGFTPPTYECGECGWRGKTVLKATNKSTTFRDVVLVAEANDAVREKERKTKGNLFKRKK